MEEPMFKKSPSCYFMSTLMEWGNRLIALLNNPAVANQKQKTSNTFVPVGLQSFVRLNLVPKGQRQMENSTQAKRREKLYCCQENNV